MASFLDHAHDVQITIPKTEETDKFTLYEIHINMGNVFWIVDHRYNDFSELHEVLAADHGVTKDLLPPKRMIRNKEPSFIEKRRKGLETYLVTVVRFLQKTMPRILAMFLDFHKYEILFLLQNLSLHFFNEGEFLLARCKSFSFTPLQLHAMTWRVKQPCPQLEIVDQRQNFSHLLDFCSKLVEIQIRGSSEKIQRSSIIPNNLVFEIIGFKILEKLTLIEVNIESIKGVGQLRENLKILNIYDCGLKCLALMFLCDNVHKDLSNLDRNLKWANITELNIVNNNLQEIDLSITLLPNLEKLNLENNQISSINNLEYLKKLKYLNLSFNKFEVLDDLDMKLCSITSLDLSQNKIKTLSGFSKLASLESLDVKSNLISDLNEVKYLTGLLFLENLILTGNPLSVVVDYRIKVLELFDNRAMDICLDNEKSTQKELDKVAILQAIRIAKEKRFTIS